MLAAEVGDDVVGNESWIYQGRQYHMWFGHGTKPADDGGRVETLAERLHAIGSTLVASLPERLRHHALARLASADHARLDRMLGGMVAKRGDGLHVIARDVLDASPAAPGILPLVAAGLLIGTGQSAAVTMAVSDLVGQSAAEMGPDRFLALLRRVGDAQPALDEAGLRPSEGKDIASATLRIMQPEFVPAPYQTAAIAYDPRKIPLTPEADAVEVRLNEITRAIVQAWDGQVEALSPQQLGTLLHVQLAQAVRAANIPGVVVEQGMDPDGRVARYGQDASVGPT